MSTSTSQAALSQSPTTDRHDLLVQSHDDLNQEPTIPPPSHASNPSLFSALSYPVSYTVSGLLRRISADEAPTPLARALSANYNGSISDYGSSSMQHSAIFHPPSAPNRRVSPFQPPPLTPLSLSGYRDSTHHRGRLLSRSLAEEIRLLVPPRLQLVANWQLAYSLEQDGSSISSLFSACARHKGKRGGFVLAVRDNNGGIFGAYLSDAPHPAPHYYGTGECFLWRCFRLPSLPDLSSLPPPPSEDTTNATRMTTVAALHSSSNSSSAASSANPSLTSSRTNTRDPSPSAGSMTSAATGPTLAEQAARQRHRERAEGMPLRFKAFPYTGDNDFLILCGADYLSVGGGNGRYGLWLDDRLAKGVSSECTTFGNEELSDVGSRFGVLGVEVWYVGS